MSNGTDHPAFRRWIDTALIAAHVESRTSESPPCWREHGPEHDGNGKAVGTCKRKSPVTDATGGWATPILGSLPRARFTSIFASRVAGRVTANGGRKPALPQNAPSTVGRSALFSNLVWVDATVTGEGVEWIVET